MSTAVFERVRTTSWALPGMRSRVPGLAAVAVVAVVATRLGSWFPVIGAPVFGIVLGVAGALVLRRRQGVGEVLAPGVTLAAAPLLKLSVVLLGTGLSLAQVVRTGAGSLPVMLGTLAVALGGAVVGGRLLNVGGATRTLVGVGTGICGASAIAATTAVIGAAESEVAYAIATIFTFNVAAVLLFPVLGHLLGLSQHAFGLWAGTAVNDTSSVVAATTTYGTAAAGYGIVVKLSRSLMIVPVTAALAVRAARRAHGGTVRRLPWRRMLPLFLVGFLAASALDTAGLVPTGWHHGLTVTSGFLITMALAGIGLSTRPDALRAAGLRPLALGGVLWVAVAATSIGLQGLTGTL